MVVDEALRSRAGRETLHPRGDRHVVGSEGHGDHEGGRVVRECDWMAERSFCTPGDVWGRR